MPDFGSPGGDKLADRAHWLFLDESCIGQQPQAFSE
jgi:hypothetical protein